MIQRVPFAYKISIAIIFMLILIFMSVNSIYKSVFNEQWDKHSEVISVAMAQTELVKATNVESFSFEDYFMVVYGEDSEQRNMIVWVGEDEIHSEYAEDGYNRNLLRLKMREIYSDIQIIKMTPGKYKDDWVWEVLYRQSPSDRHTYYDYYRFSDGELLLTLTMSSRR